MQAVATKNVIDIEDIKKIISSRMDSASYTSWIAPLDFTIRGQVLVLTAQNKFSADFINSVHLNVLNNIANEYGLSVSVGVKNMSYAKQQTVTANDNNVQVLPKIKNEQIPVCGFDSFIVSDDNAFVVSACKKIATDFVSFSPLFIYGPAGSGKTLLVNCISSSSRGRIVMMSGGQFVSEFARSLRDKNVFAFKDFCRNCDTFILDGIQALSNKLATINEFIQLVLDLRNAGKNIVITSTVAPNNLSGFDRQIQSLLASGLVADVSLPNLYVKKTMLLRANISTEVVEFLSNHIANDGHLVSGIINKIKAYVELMGEKITVEAAQRLLSDTLQQTKTPLALVKSMCDKLGVSYEAVCGNCRTRALVVARQTMMVVLKRVTNLSLTEIGRLCGDRDHATVLYSIAQIEKASTSDLVLTAQIEQFISEYK